MSFTGASYKVHNEVYRGLHIRIFRMNEPDPDTGGPLRGYTVEDPHHNVLDTAWTYLTDIQALDDARSFVDQYRREKEADVAQNWHKSELADGTMLYYSYKQLIGLWSPRVAHTFHAPVFTDESFSRTTSRHRNDFITDTGGEIVPAKAFALIRQEVGV